MKNRLIRLLLWYGLKMHRCNLAILKNVEFIYSDNYKKLNRTAGFDKKISFTHVVINQSGVYVHGYHSDPREPYDYRKYESLDSFIAKFLQGPISARDAKSALSTKEINFEQKASRDQNISQEQRIEHMMRFSRLVEEARSRMDDKAQREVSTFMSGFVYKIFRFVINKKI